MRGICLEEISCAFQRDHYGSKLSENYMGMVKEAISVGKKQWQWWLISIIGQRCTMMWRSWLEVVTNANLVKGIHKTLVYTLHYKFQKLLVFILAWIVYWISKESKGT